MTDDRLEDEVESGAEPDGPVASCLVAGDGSLSIAAVHAAVTMGATIVDGEGARGPAVVEAGEGAVAVAAPGEVDAAEVDGNGSAVAGSGGAVSSAARGLTVELGTDGLENRPARGLLVELLPLNESGVDCAATVGATRPLLTCKASSGFTKPEDPESSP